MIYDFALKFPPKKLQDVKKWCNINREELLENWDKAKLGQSLNYIKPL
ncbi:MAG: DUF4160 domain-containing protein [Pseudomonadota bacterium]